MAGGDRVIGGAIAWDQTIAGPTATAILASNAAGEAAYQASQIEGISAGDVALIGLTAGTIEYLTEKVGSR